MPGYPAKITRDNLGPTFVNEVKVTNPSKEADADTFNLLCWQVAGMNGPAPRGFNLCAVSGGVITVLARWFAWDPNQALPDVQWVYSSTGTYIYTLPNAGSGVGIYADAKGVLTQVTLLASFVSPQTNLNSNAVHFLLSGVSGQVGVYNASTGVSIDVNKFAIWFI